MIDTRTAVVSLNAQGTVCVRVRKGATQTMEDARANVAAALDQCGDVRRPILIDIREAVPLDAEVRRYYSGTVLVDSFTSMALLINASPLGRMIGNVYLRVANTGIPTRLFTEESQAHEWLNNHA